MKRIILCADDYAQSAAISAGIMQLVEMRRLSAVSCFSDAPFWSQSENTLCDHRDRIDIGLHFNLTHAFPAATMPPQTLGVLIRAALTGTIDRNAIIAALRSQLDRFEAVTQTMPDFVDGHQHVHILPGIRDLVVAELAQRYGRQKPWLRAVNPRLPGHGGLIKLLVLKLLGSGFSALSKRHGFETNRNFAGIYSLQPQADFAALMCRWLGEVRDGDLLMCHPGAATIDNSDPIAATRPRELALLQSDEFGAFLSRNAVSLSRFHDIAA